jgi:type I restriction enzyme S subunit
VSSCEPHEEVAKPALTPKLRFPEFRSDPAWEIKELHTLADPVSERADGEDQNNILTLSGEHGLVLQTEYFGKQIAGSNSERYLKIQRNDFVYNDRTTKASEYGTIKRLTKHPHGIVSPIYKCFRFRAGELPVFWEWYFESGAHQAQLRSLANEGARAGRFNVSIDRFLSTSVCTPERGSNEQQKIAECLSTLDELIGAESQKLDSLKAHKKGLMQQLFPREGETLPRLRFPEFHSAPEWDVRTIGHMFRLINGCAFKPEDWKTTGTPIIRIQNLNDPSAEFNYAQEPVSEANRIEPGDLLFAWSGTLGSSFGARIWNGPSGVLNQHIFKVLMNEQLIAPRYALLVLARVEEDIAKKTHGFKASFVHVKKSDLVKIELPLPSVAEQHRIATCLSSLDEVIAAQSDRLSALQTHKQGLLQQLFPSPGDACV